MEELQKQIKILEERLSKLEDQMSYDESEKLKDRFFEVLGVSNTQNINLTGNVQTITVPNQPTGTLTLVYKGNRYKLLYE